MPFTWIYNRFSKLPYVYLDGVICVLLAIFMAIGDSFNSDEAAKYLDPWRLFWARSACGWIAQGLLALKLYRSTSYSDHIAMDKAKIPKTTEVPKD
jgi:hypothetical protein